MTNDDIINFVIRAEGGFTNNPNDRGGATNFGITAATLNRYLCKPGVATPDEVRAMTEATARAIYAKFYIAEPRFERIANAALRLVVVDAGVLHGVGHATEWLQSAVSATVDGDFGEETSAKIAAYAQPNLLARRVLAKRFAAIASIVKNDPSQLEFLVGWINRAASLLDYV